jgi:acyl-CoA reductase-like NAD-dependent aldehyde dehydrogenase
MYVAGEWHDGGEDEIVNPYSGETVATVARADAGDVDRALGAAVEGAATMRRMSARERADILQRAADLCDERVEQLAATITSETGKALREARAEALRAGDIFRLSAAAGLALRGEGLPLGSARGAADKLGITLRQPCGVVVAIAPFNYPVLLTMHKVGPALAAGNAVVLKPARQTPLSALRLCEILLEAGLPEHALQVVTGSGVTLGPPLCMDRRVRKISFTGSTEVGEQIAAVAGVKRLSLELGSSCPLVVLPDADPQEAAAAIALGGYANAGQVCISLQRVIADRAIHADLLDALLPAVEAIRLGDPRDEATTMGCLISEREAARVERMLEEASADGARVIVGGERDGARMSPAVVDGVDPSSPLAQEELFGPAVAISTVDGVEEAIAFANSTPYGLAAGIFTRDLKAALRFAREVDAGILQINSSPLWRADLMPYGGLKASGVGKEGPEYAIEEMTELKSVVFHGLEHGA